MPPNPDKLNAERQRLRQQNGALIKARQRDLEDDDKSRYPDDEVDFDSRYSIFDDSQERSRISILDKERSSNVRQQFLKRVEEMYSKDGINRGMAPPVPKLPPLSPSRR